MIPENARKHPWGGFLHERARAIAWLKKEFGYNDLQIAHKLSMDETQVYLIRTNPFNKDVFDCNQEK